jgi:hypothetical protein
MIKLPDSFGLITKTALAENTGLYGKMAERYRDTEKEERQNWRTRRGALL